MGRGNVESILARQPWSDLGEHLIRAGADSEATLERIRAYATLLLTWNRDVSNLISSSDESRFVARHLRESLEPAHWLREARGERWLDFGSGGGLPAIPLAICGVGWSWTMVESRRTKTLFLRKAIQDLGLERVTVVNDRLENLVADPEYVAAFDGFTSRATQTLGPTLKLAASLVKPGGEAFLWKGSRREQEMADDPFWRATWQLEGMLETGTEGTVVCRFKRAAG